MPNPIDKGYFVELNDFSLILARCSALRAPFTIEEIREVPLDNKAGLEEAVKAVFPETGSGTARVLASLRPKQRGLYLAGADTAKRFPSLDTLDGVLAEPALASLAPAEFTAVYVRDGLTISGQGAPWLLAAASKDSFAQAIATLKELKLEPARISPATLTAAGAIAAALKLKGDGSTALLFDFGDVSTQLLLVGKDGVEAVRPASVTMDKVAEAVQVELGLKFKGSAAKLFFNESYDFSETGPKIAGRIAQELSGDISALGRPAAAFACAGLPGKQNWFASSLAGALNLAPLALDLKACNVSLAGAAAESNPTSVWFGFLNFIGSYQPASPESSPWQPDWTRTAPPSAAKPAAPAAVITTPPAKPAAPAAPVAPPPAAKPVAPPAAIIPPAAKPAPAAGVTPPPARPAAPAAPFTPPSAAKPLPPAAAKPLPPAAAKPLPPSMAAKPAAPFTPAKPVTPAAAIPPTKPATPAAPATPVKPATPGPITPAKPTPPVSTPVSAKPATPAPVTPLPRKEITPAPAAPKPATPVTPAKPAPTPAAKPATPPPPARPAPVASSGAKPSFIKSPAGMITIAAVVIVLGLVGYIYYGQQKAAEQERVRVAAEQKAKHDAEMQLKKDQDAAAALKKSQEETAAKLAAAEAAAKQAEEQARIETAAHLAAARGKINLTTDPAGATVIIGNLPPRTTPVLLDDVKLGHYPVTITLRGYDSAKLDLEVRENETADPGTIKLTRQTGSLEITSEPAGSNYSVRPAGVGINLLNLSSSTPESSGPTTIFDESWSDGDRFKQNPPSSLAWFCSGNSASVAVDKGSLKMSTDGASKYVVAYFPKQTLKVGDTITLTYQVSLTGPLQQIGNASSTSLKVGLFDSRGGYTYTADNQQGGNPVSYMGYATGADFNAPGDNSNSPLNVRKRIDSSGNLISSNSGLFYLMQEKEPSKQTWQPDTPYTGVLTIHMLDPNQLKITCTYTGGDFNDYTVVATDQQSATADNRPVVTSFDTVAFCLPSTGGQAAARAVTLSNVKLTYTNGSPGMNSITPATLDNLAAGDYVVTISREGFASHDENVSIERGGTAHVAWKFTNGNVILTSTPSGASVSSDGKVIGSTPLTLSDLQPGDVSYDLNLLGYDTTTVSGKVEDGETLKLDAAMLSVDRIAKLADLDVRPQAIKQEQPSLPGDLNTESGEVDIALTVDRFGNPKDPEVVKNTTKNKDVPRYCMEAIAKWKFKPGMIDGKPVNVRVTIPFTISSGGGY